MSTCVTSPRRPYAAQFRGEMRSSVYRRNGGYDMGSDLHTLPDGYFLASCQCKVVHGELAERMTSEQSLLRLAAIRKKNGLSRTPDWSSARLFPAWIIACGNGRFLNRICRSRYYSVNAPTRHGCLCRDGSIKFELAVVSSAQLAVCRNAWLDVPRRNPKTVAYCRLSTADRDTGRQEHHARESMCGRRARLDPRGS